jgi:hypothetical protein
MASPRFAVYVACTIASLLVGYALGKDMMWDTLDYHLYAGFSALHDRFGQDYFAAGAQSYFNPYIYIPLYLLVASKVSALAAAFVLAALESGILWLSYELALAAVPEADQRKRTAIGVCVVLLALANPILVNQLGASSADVLTGELVLGGWLLLARAIRAPAHLSTACAGLLLGAASALKLTNSVHALAACLMLLFLPVTWRMKLRYAVSCGVAMICGFLLLAVPWAMHLEQYFGNPLFPLLNGFFRSPQFPTTGTPDLRFVPSSLGGALWRPFAIAAPVSMVDDEFAAPDLRYSLLVVLIVLALLRWSYRFLKSAGRPDEPSGRSGPTRVLLALGSAFLIDWTLWLIASGNGRYFIPTACVAAVLAIALLFRLLAARTKLRNYLLAILFAAQALEVCAGATYRDRVAWDGGPWFEISAPTALVRQRDLYFAFEEQSNSFIVPFLARASGFINVDGDYVLSSGGANGEHIRRLIREYSPRLRTLVLQPSANYRDGAWPPDLSHENDTLAHFGLRVDTSDCQRIKIRDIQAPWTDSLTDGMPLSGGAATSRVARVKQPTDGFLVTCRISPTSASDTSLIADESRADLVFDRLERACPRLFQPAGSVTLDFGDARQGYSWMRRYGATGLSVVIMDGIVRFIDPIRGGPAVYLGRASDWEKSSLALSCWRRDERYHAALR